MPPIDALSISMDQKLMEQEREEEERRKELSQELVQYWAMYQRSEDSRDADINYNQQGGSSVILVNQNSLGPASMQVFQVFTCIMSVVLWFSCWKLQSVNMMLHIGLIRLLC